MKPITIPLHKSKAVKLFIIFVIMVIASALMVTRPQLFTHGTALGFIKTVGYICTVIFVLAATIVSNKVFNRKPGLIIDDEGITDNSMGVPFQKVLWKDVAAIKKMQSGADMFITLVLKNPETYIANEPNTVKRKMLKLNYQALKTPVNIAAGRLKIDFDKLYAAIMNKLQERI